MRMKLAVCFVVGATLSTIPALAASDNVSVGSRPVAPAGALERRLNAVENKTDDYRIKRMRKTKTWIRPRFALTRNAPEAGRSGSTPATVGKAGSAQTLFFEIPISEETPISATIWLDFSMSYHATGPGEVQIVSNTLINNVVTQALCGPTFDVAATGGSALEMKKEFVCQGLINRQIGERLRVGVFLRSETAEITVANLTVDARLVNQVLIKPEIE